MIDESEWYKTNKCTHAHCPNDCEKPQPFIFEGKLICGRCAILDNIIIEMIPCTPENCNEKS